MREYDTSEPVTFEAQSAPEVVETVEIEGQPVAIVRLATLTMPAADATPVFGRSNGFYAMFAGAEVHTLSRAFYLNRGAYHAAGEGTGGRAVASVKGGELARSTTVKGAIKGARERIERDRLFAQYAPVAVANVGSHTRADFEALDADATIEPGDLVVVVSHSKFRTGVAVKVGKTRVECLASTPTGGRANGATRTMGKDVRLLRKATPAAPAEQGEVATASPATPAAPAEQGEVATATPAAPAAPASEPVTPRGRWAVGLPPASVPSVDESLAEAAAGFRAVRDSRTTNRVEDVDGRLFGAGAVVEVVDGSSSTSIVGAARALLAEVVGWRGRVVAVDAEPGRGEWVKLDWVGRPGGLVLWADRVRVIDEPTPAEPALEGAAPAAPAHTDPVDAEGWGEAVEEGPESRDCVRVYTRQTSRGREQWCATHRAYEPIGDDDDGPVLDADEDRRAAAGRVFAQTEGMTDAGEGSTLYRVVRARVGDREVRIHDASGEWLGTVREGFVDWLAQTPSGGDLAAPDGGLVSSFAAAVATVRAAAAGQIDDQGATVAAREGEDMGQTEAPAGEPGRDAVDALLALVREHGIDPATLRAVADQVERDRAGHVTEIEVDGAGHFAWRCLLGDAEQTGLEVGETAYAAATAHGPLAADSPFVRGPVIVHEGRGDNERGVPRRALAGSLRFEPFDGGFWFLSGYASTDEIEEEDEGIVAAQAWAAGLMAHPGYGEPSAVVVARWEHHRDSYGQWWEPVIR